MNVRVVLLSMEGPEEEEIEPSHYTIADDCYECEGGAFEHGERGGGRNRAYATILLRMIVMNVRVVLLSMESPEEEEIEPSHYTIADDCYECEGGAFEHGERGGGRNRA
jgi:hypothetical protein